MIRRCHVPSAYSGPVQMLQKRQCIHVVGKGVRGKQYSGNDDDDDHRTDQGFSRESNRIYGKNSKDELDIGQRLADG